jgi:hypothetical protein
MGGCALKIGDSVRKAIADWELGDTEAAMLHACNAVDGTARKLHSTEENKSRFTRLLRDNYSILGPIALPGVDLTETRFPVNVKRPTAPGGRPDLADLVYAIHRCTHGHGDELPSGFELIPDARSGRITRTLTVNNAVRLSDRIIFGLVAVAVLSPVNVGQRAADDSFLTYPTYNGYVKLPINQWWGRLADFRDVLGESQMHLVKMDYGDRMP